MTAPEDKAPVAIEDLAIRQFMSGISSDGRISPVHVSLFLAIVYYGYQRGFGQAIYAFSHELMPLAKISSSATYHKYIKDLHYFGYIDYEPSCSRILGSRIELLVNGRK